MEPLADIISNLWRNGMPQKEEITVNVTPGARYMEKYQIQREGMFHEIVNGPFEVICVGVHTRSKQELVVYQRVDGVGEVRISPVVVFTQTMKPDESDQVRSEDHGEE